MWEIGRKCEGRVAAWRITQVDADGRYWISGTNATSGNDFFACMHEQAQRQPYAEWFQKNRASYPDK